ncbi:MAG TPA: His/Gly/Thr/Pro-type tRNA ligase C-terminal domain-containing protein, partial [Candidatus Acidoferrales bacterium]|nr:His/Gly/Thr/Pro-type tRNA ligase C-terminal domain-containing protein [Candidatus Acidoferrales bacterium]
QNAVCGGGRYDGLVELLGGPPTKGIGFAIGTDRVILSQQESGHEPQQAAAKARREQAPALHAALDVFIAWMGAAAQPEAVKLARKLRDAGLSVEVPAEEMKFKKSIGLADKLGARFALIIGENELKEGKYALKRLSDGVQEKIGAGELISAVRKIGV